MAPAIAVFVFCLAFVFSACFLVVDRLTPTGASPFVRRKICYQMTNFIANATLGFCGLYYELWIRPRSVTVEEQIQGFAELYLYGCFQLGFQLWAIPVGMFLVNESTAMLTHHFAVIFVASMSTFFQNGFRYYTPFFYGLIELSSVPLAIMNTFKDNPDLVKRHPLAYTAIRIIFALSFLYIRIILFTPRMYAFLRDHWLLFSQSSHRPYQIFMSIVWVSSFFLLLLQWFWASLIVRGLLKAGRKVKKSGVKEE